jgi:hypothetical protein
MISQWNELKLSYQCLGDLSDIKLNPQSILLFYLRLFIQEFFLLFLSFRNGHCLVFSRHFRDQINLKSKLQKEDMQSILNSFELYLTLNSFNRLKEVFLILHQKSLINLIYFLNISWNLFIFHLFIQFFYKSLLTLITFYLAFYNSINFIIKFLYTFLFYILLCHLLKLIIINNLLQSKKSFM